MMSLAQITGWWIDGNNKMLVSIQTCQFKDRYTHMVLLRTCRGCALFSPAGTLWQRGAKPDFTSVRSCRLLVFPSLTTCQIMFALSFFLNSHLLVFISSSSWAVNDVLWSWVGCAEDPHMDRPVLFKECLFYLVTSLNVCFYYSMTVSCQIIIWIIIQSRVCLVSSGAGWPPPRSC